MRIFALITGLAGVFALLQPVQAESRTSAVVLDVEGGSSAFAISADRDQAWWLKGECRVAIPLDTAKSTGESLVGAPQTDVVQLGNRNIRMTQQFRFDFTSDDVIVSIYSSVRGGWAAVPTKRDRACEASACRTRTELPEC